MSSLFRQQDRRKRRGMEVVEFVLTFPLFLLILGGSMDFGWLYFQKSLLDTAVTTGCRSASLIDPGEGDSQIEGVYTTGHEAILDSLAAGGAACSDCVTHIEVFGDFPGRSLTCSVSRGYEPLFGVIPPMDFQSTTAIRFEWQR